MTAIYDLARERQIRSARNVARLTRQGARVPDKIIEYLTDGPMDPGEAFLSAPSEYEPPSVA